MLACVCLLSGCVLAQVSYGIGLSEPLSVYVDTYKTGKLPDEEIQEAVTAAFDFRPGMIIQVGAVCLWMCDPLAWGASCLAVEALESSGRGSVHATDAQLMPSPQVSGIRRQIVVGCVLGMHSRLCL